MLQASKTLQCCRLERVTTENWGTATHDSQFMPTVQDTPKVIEALRGERVVEMSAGITHSIVSAEAGEALSYAMPSDRSSEPTVFRRYSDVSLSSSTDHRVAG